MSEYLLSGFNSPVTRRTTLLMGAAAGVVRSRR